MKKYYTCNNVELEVRVTDSEVYITQLLEEKTQLQKQLEEKQIIIGE